MQTKNKVVKNLPNVVTSLNLLSGSIAIVLAFENNDLLFAAYFIILAAVFDFFDGLLARALGAFSDLGKNLDSLADVISFGLAPSVIIFKMLLMSLTYRDASFNFETASFVHLLILFSAFLIAVFGAIRLARFNIDTNQKYEFRGLAIPANALFFAALAILLLETRSEAVQSFILNTWLLEALIVVFSVLMVSGIRMFSLKFETLKFNENSIRYLFLILAVLLLLFFGAKSLVAIIPIYVIFSILRKKPSKA
jgi:CDP-diacylglycerol--serine O-phosphatidyltransferase